MRKQVVVIVMSLVLLAAAAGWWALRRDAGPQAPPQADATGEATPRASAPEDSTKRAARVRAHLARYQHLWREAGIAEVRKQAAAGDVLAQRRLSEIYEDCLAYTTRLRSSLELLRQLGGAEPASKPAVEMIFAEIDRLCPPAITDLIENRQVAEYWLHRSAKGGDPVAEMRYFARANASLTQGQLAYFLKKLRASGEPDAMFEMSLLLSRVAPDAAWPDPAQAPALQGSNAEQAWVLAACHAGFDCLRGSRLMKLLCINTLSCGQPDYPRYLAASAGYSAQKPEIQRLRAVIEGNLLATEP